MRRFKHKATNEFWTKGSFIHFLRYLIDEKEYSAHGIANVVEAPYKWKDDFTIYINGDYQKEK